MSNIKSPAPTVAQLKTSLKALKDALDPITSQSMELLVSRIEESGSGNGKIESAQMHTSLAYIILDLVWILLKVSGVNPKEHPVTNDLVRVQEYLKKVHAASKRKESEGAKIDEEKPGPIDNAKVGRFLRHALGTPASGKKTVFAEDGSISEIVDAGKSKEEILAASKHDEVQKQEGKEGNSSDWKKATSKKAISQAQKAEKAIKKAASSITDREKKRHKNK